MMKWIDVHDIAWALSEEHEGVDPRYIRFSDLHRWVCALKDFDDTPERSNERILEAIQMAWIDEVNL